MQPDEALALAVDAVEKARERLLVWRAQRQFNAKVVGGTVKAEVDHMAHDCLVETLGASGHPVLSEEEPWHFDTDRPARYWLIDPLDGTASFVEGYAGFVTQVAFMERGRPVAAAVCAPALDLLYTAVVAGGAKVNGRSLRSLYKGGGIRLIDNYPEPRGFAARVHAGLPCGGYVESGSIGLKICRVADGTADLFVKDVPVRDWDIAAPNLVLGEAGGSVLGLDRKEFTYSGRPEHNGLVAASSMELTERFLQWQAAP
jgi:3'-phosphoadenosine 5'-phosphosulfate (PAPS) 3'-phosphatase